MLKVDPWIFFVFSDCHATKREFPHYVHLRDMWYICVLFIIYVILITLQRVPFILYQDMESLVLGVISLNTDEFASILGVFMPSQAPWQANFRHLPLGPKFEWSGNRVATCSMFSHNPNTSTLQALHCMSDRLLTLDCRNLCSHDGVGRLAESQPARLGLSVAIARKNDSDDRSAQWFASSWCWQFEVEYGWIEVLDCSPALSWQEFLDVWLFVYKPAVAAYSIKQ